jgi:hypothetical protein
LRPASRSSAADRRTSGAPPTIREPSTNIEVGAQSFSRSAVRRLDLSGSGDNVFGFHGQNVWYFIAEEVSFQGHGIAGAALSVNENSSVFRDCRFLANGTSDADRVTGGVLLNTPNENLCAGVIFDNCFFTDNFGWGVAATSDFAGQTPWSDAVPVSGVTLRDCQINLTYATQATGSGTGAYLGGDHGNCNVIGLWVESCDTLPLRINPDDGTVNLIGCHVDGGGGRQGAVDVTLVIDQGPGYFSGAANLIGCQFTNAAQASVSVSANVVADWSGCTADDGVPFLVTDGGATAAAARAARSVGSYCASGTDSPPVGTVAAGLAQLSGGTAAIGDADVTAGSLIRLTRQQRGGTAGELSVSLTPGTGFAIESSSADETSTIFWELVSY